MTQLQKKVKALLSRLENLFDQSIEQRVDFDEVNEYMVIHEMVEVIREQDQIDASTDRVINTMGLTLVPKEETDNN